MRPPNLPTAAADILAGAALAGVVAGCPGSECGLAPYAADILLLVISSVCLYAGGVVLNDVFDARLDTVERPERPIPSGLVPRYQAAWFGGILLVAGVALAGWVRPESAYVAVWLAGGILLYDAYAKNRPFAGPLVMGLCRTLNLWLGMSLVPLAAEGQYLWVPLLYIFAVTTVSRGEVSGGRKNQLLLAIVLYAIVIFGVGILVATETDRLWWVLPFLLLLGAMVYTPVFKAWRQRSPQQIRAAVKGGVLGIVALDAAWAAGYGTVWAGLAVLLLLLVSRWLARQFAVT